MALNRKTKIGNYSVRHWVTKKPRTLIRKRKKQGEPCDRPSLVMGRVFKFITQRRRTQTAWWSCLVEEREMRIEKIKRKCQKISAGLQRYLFKSSAKLICTHRRKSPEATERATGKEQTKIPGTCKRLGLSHVPVSQSGATSCSIEHRVVSSEDYLPWWWELAQNPYQHEGSHRLYINKWKWLYSKKT